MKTVRENLKEENREYVDWMCYMSTGKDRTLYHTDFIEYVDPEIHDVLDGYEVVDDQLMDEFDFTHSILANTDEYADFQRDYNDENAKVLVMIVREAGETEEDGEAKELARKIRNAESWDEVLDEVEELCELADMSEEWEEADDDTAESVIFEAAEKLGVEIL